VQKPLGSLGEAFGGLGVHERSEEVGTEGSKGSKGEEEKEKPLWKMGRVVLRRERAHRGGKTVVVVDDFATHLPMSVIEAAAKKLRAGCGCGGTVKDRRIEIQGDQPAKVRAILEAGGFQVAGVKLPRR